MTEHPSSDKRQPVVFLRDVEMSSTSSADTMNFLHFRGGRKQSQDKIYTQNTPDGKVITVKRKSRLDGSLRDGMIFDAIGIQFHASIFFYQLLVHLVFPLFFTVQNKYGQGLRCVFQNLMWNIFYPLIVYIMIISYFACSYSDQALLGQSIFIPLMFYLVHRCILSLKYASLSRTEYDRFLKAKDKRLTDGYVQQIHLKSGWMDLDPSVLYFEIGAASARVGCKINQLYIYICECNGSSISSESQFRYWNAFLRGHDTIDWDSKPAPEIKNLPSGRVGVSVYNVVMALVLRAASKDSHPFYIKFFLFGIVVLIIAISYVPLVLNWNVIDNKILGVIFQVCSTIINAKFGYVFFSLLFLAIVDIKRQKRMVEMLHCMIRSTDLMMHNDLSILPAEVVLSDHCKEVAKARLNAILSITDEHIVEITNAADPQAPLERIEEDDEKTEEETKDYFPQALAFRSEFDSLNEGDDEANERESEVLGENIAQEASFALTPRITFRFAENVTAWLYTRLTIQHFGDRFRARIDCYVGVSLILTLFLMLFALITVFSAEDRQVAFNSLFFVQSLLAVTLLLFYLLIIFSLGSSVNEELELHRKTLMIRAIKIRSKIQCLKMYLPTSREIEGLSEVMENISMAKEAMEVNNELKPLQILGFNAQRAFTVTILTAAISFYSTLFTLYFKGGNLSTVASSASV